MLHYRICMSGNAVSNDVVSFRSQKRQGISAIHAKYLNVAKKRFRFNILLQIWGTNVRLGHAFVERWVISDRILKSQFIVSIGRLVVF